MELIDTMFGPHIDWKQVVLTAMTPLFLIAFAIEWQVMRGRGRREPFQGKEIVANLMLGGAYQIFEVIAHALITAAAVAWFWQHRLIDELPVNGWTILPIFFAVEFCYYLFHRGSHRIRWFWTAHVVHHTGRVMNMTTAMRQSLLYSITGWWLFWMPMVLLGVHPSVVFFLYGVNLAYQYFVHTESVGKLHPWIEYVFNTPSHHRVHHGRNPQYIDRNFGGVLILFDRWFGSFEPEVERVDYGIAVRQPTSYNAITLNFHEFADLCRDMRKPGPIVQRLKHLVMPPEWQRTTTD